MEEIRQYLHTLKTMLHSFASGEDQSRELVQEIDTLLSEAFSQGVGFPDPDAFEDLEVAAACYRPGGGQFMYDEAQMASVCASVLARLNQPSAR